MSRTTIDELVLIYADGRRVVVCAKLKERGSGVVAQIQVDGEKCIVVSACTPLQKLVSRVSSDAPTLAIRLSHAPGNEKWDACI